MLRLPLNHVQVGKVAVCRPHMQRVTGEAHVGKLADNLAQGRRGPQHARIPPRLLRPRISGISVSCRRTAPERPSPAQAPHRSSLRASPKPHQESLHPSASRARASHPLFGAILSNLGKKAQSVSGPLRLGHDENMCNGSLQPDADAPNRMRL